MPRRRSALVATVLISFAGLLSACSQAAPAALGRAGLGARAIGQAPPVPTSRITLQVRSARQSLSPKGPKALHLVPHYRWLLNLDTGGTPEGGKDNPLCHPSTNPTYPQGCNWPSVRYAVASPVVSEGTDDDWNATTPLPTFDRTTGRGLPDACDAYGYPVAGPLSQANGHGYPVKSNGPAGTATTQPCRYLVSVMADGYQIGGAHFSVPTLGSGLEHVWLNPGPIPLGTVRIKVFDDNAPADGTYDETTESGLQGFLGLLDDFDGVVSADYFGNPLCTQYLVYQNTNPAAPGYTTDATRVGLVVLSASGRPTPLPAHDPAPPDANGYYNPTVPGRCLSDSNGDIVIPNLAPNHYSAIVTPPDDAPDRWIQTTTLEGNHDFDVWVMPDDTGNDTELVVGGEAVPYVQFGFTPATPQPSTWACPAGGSPGQTPGCGVIRGQLFGAIPYVPGIGALPGVGGANGTSGMKLDRPIDRGWVALNTLDLSLGDFDHLVSAIPTDASGNFTFTNVPDGDYFMTIWDQPQEYALDRFNVTVSNGQVVDMGVLPLLGWFSHIYGHVFIDKNGNGRMDPGDQGLFHMQVQNLNRTNNAMEGGINTSFTDNSGFYDFKEAYPLGLMSVNQFFNTRFKTTGVTWQACNDPQEHTVVAPMVDVSYLPMIGHCGRLDWGVQPYTPGDNGDNGGIVATTIEDEIRQKYNARQAQTLDYQTGIPGFRMEQYTPVKGSGPGGTDPLSGYALNADGSFQTVEPLQPQNGQDCANVDPAVLCYVTENNGPPSQCYPRDANGNPIGWSAVDPRSLDFYTFGGACIESSAQSTQFGLGTDNPGAPLNHPIQTVDGNYTLGNKPVIPARNLGDVLVRDVVPADSVLPPDPVTGVDRPLYQFTTEEDVNTSTGTQYVPQGADQSLMTWPPPAGAPHPMPTGDPSTPDLGYEENPYTTAPGPDPICAGPTHVVDVTNPNFLHSGGSPLQGATRHLCDTKLLNIQAGQSIAPNFHVRTAVDIPLPTHFWGYIVDDVSVETNRASTNIGEVHGIPGVPVGIYDWTGRRNWSVTSDYNGTWEVLMPSADIFNCPTPAGTCPNVYRFVGNDPGQPGEPNPNYDPNYRTISANFQAWPNMLVPADAAPTRVVTSIEGPGVQFSATHPCGVKATEPQLFAVSPRPYTNVASETLTIQGANFGATTGIVRYTPESTNAPVDLPISSWTDNEIHLTVGTNLPPGAGTLSVISASIDPTTHRPLTSTNGLTFHVIAGDYTPTIVEVGPGKQFDPFSRDAQGNLLHPYVIQDALEFVNQQWQQFGINEFNSLVASGQSVDQAMRNTANDPRERYLVVVYPRWDPSGADNRAFVPLGTYFENIILHSPVKLQGVGPGGSYTDAGGGVHAVQGSIIDGRYWASVTAGVTDGFEPNGEGGPDVGPDPHPDKAEPVVQHWVALIDSLEAGPPEGNGTNPYGTGFQLIDTGTPEGTPFAWSGNNEPLGEGAVITQIGTTGTYNNAGYNAAVDGFTISGGDQADFPGNVNEVSGTRTGHFPEGDNTLTDETAGALSIQGGAIYVNGGTDNFRVTNNLVKQNSSAYGTVRFGTLFQGDPALEGGMSHNWNAAVSHNTFVANGGTNLAGAIGLYDDTVNYSIDHNTFCMNTSAEYGGAVSHQGYSPGGRISSNKMYLNTAFDEGGAITINSEPGFSLLGAVGDAQAVPDPSVLSQGTGPVSIDHNYIGDNLAQDDGGAIRIMGTAGTRDLSPITVADNMITNNVSAHEGGAVSIGDAPVVNLVNNTIAKNLTTATATSSNGAPAPAGLSSGLNSSGLNTLLQTKYATAIPAWMGVSSWPAFSNALIQNDVFWDNRAGSWTPNGVAGIGMTGDTTALNPWDVGSVDQGVLLTVSHSLISTPANAPTQGYKDGGGNVSGDPAFAGAYDTRITVVQQRTYFRFRPSAIISVDLPDNALGDYHLTGGSPAVGVGTDGVAGSCGIVPGDDIDANARSHCPPPGLPVDAGAHQLSPPTAATRAMAA